MKLRHFLRPLTVHMAGRKKSKVCAMSAYILLEVTPSCDDLLQGMNHSIVHRMLQREISVKMSSNLEQNLFFFTFSFIFII